MYILTPSSVFCCIHMYWDTYKAIKAVVYVFMECWCRNHNCSHSSGHVWISVAVYISAEDSEISP